MIISASRRTDVPAFYGEWLINRLKAGYFLSVNPFNPGQTKIISLKTEDVDAIVFWTKNPKPFISCLDFLDKQGYRYYFQFTLNAYPNALEPGAPPLDERIETFLRLAHRLGRERIVWRYDPIIISPAMPAAFHIETIARLIETLGNHVGRLSLAYMHPYKKIIPRMKCLNDAGLMPDNVDAFRRAENLRAIVSGIRPSADRLGLEVVTCAESENLQEFGVGHGACIDGELINRLFGLNKVFPRDKNQRGLCGCAASVDLGRYDTCPHLCIYCYANNSPDKVKTNIAGHTPDNVSII